ncbi:MAG: sugar phosphate isomerase/epimerase [Clostridia bacterium]|nr:sugar phosphate isomerase/epimerase [Clostridia bacterium]
MHKLGINYTVSTGLSPAEAFHIIKGVGFDAVFTGYFGSTEAMEPAAKAAQETGLYFECIHAPFNHINDIWSADENGDAVQKVLTDSIISADAYKIPIVVVHLSSGEHPPYDWDAGHRRWDAIIDTAVKHSVIVAFENQRKLSNLAYAMELYQDVPQARFCWDVGHEQCFARGREFMPLFGDRLVYTHIHDNTCEYNRDLHMIPFDGKIDYRRVTDHLKKANYQGTLTLEVLPENSDFYHNIPWEEYYQKAYRAADRLRGMMEE